MDQPPATGIALNVTRTRITVLAFNLTVIALMISIMSARSAMVDGYSLSHLTSSVALFVGFCLTMLGISMPKTGIWLISRRISLSTC